MKSKVLATIALVLVMAASALVLFNLKGDVDSALLQQPAQESGSLGSDGEGGTALPPRPAGDRPAEETLTAMEEKALAERDRMTALQLEQAASGFGETKSYLVEDLALSDGQAGELEMIFAQREKELKRLLMGTTSSVDGDGREIVQKICDLIRNKGLREDLVGVLSGEQLAAFDTQEAKRKQEKAEARAYRDMAEINAVVQLRESQKQEVLETLFKQAPERIENEADARAYASLSFGALAADMDSSHIRGLANMMNMDLAQDPDFEFGSEDHQQWIVEQNAVRIENALSTLKGVLDEDQLARYRGHLEAEPPR